MFDNIYSSLTKNIPYKALTVIPIILSILSLIYMYVFGIPMGLDFRGGTLMDITSDKVFDQKNILDMESDLRSSGLENLKISVGKDMETGRTKISISTTTVDGIKINKSKEALSNYFGVLRENDFALATLPVKPPEDLKAKLESRLRENVDVSYDESSKTVAISALELNKEDLESALGFYVGQKISVDLQKKNFNMNQIQPSLGEKLREDGVKAAVVGYILMAFVVFVAFRDFIPSIAVLLSATCDGIMTLGLMSFFGIPLEPASLVALIMLVGYSVDTDVLLTTRMLKRRKGELNQGVDSAIKTGLTMTATTFVVMVVVVLFSTFVTRLSTLSSIASVLVLGLIADVISTWFMNAGIMKWYVEEKGGKLNLIKSLKRKK